MFFVPNGTNVERALSGEGDRETRKSRKSRETRRTRDTRNSRESRDTRNLGILENIKEL